MTDITGGKNGSLTVDNQSGTISSVTAGEGSRNSNITNGTDATIDKVNLGQGAVVAFTDKSLSGGTGFALGSDSQLNITTDVVLGQLSGEANAFQARQKYTASGDGAIDLETLTITELGGARVGSQIDLRTYIGGDWRTSGDSANWTQITAGLLDKITDEFGLEATLIQKPGQDYATWESASINQARTAGGILGETLINQLSRRAMFIEAALSDVSQAGYWHRTAQQEGWLGFVKPYTSYDKLNLTGGSTVKGHTTGLMAGANRMYNDEHLYSVFMGYESSDSKAALSAGQLNFDMNSAYAGLKLAHAFAKAGDVTFFGKVQGFMGYTSTDLKRTYGSQTSKGSTHTYAYNSQVNVGMNYPLPIKGMLSPEVGAGIAGGKTKAFSIHGDNDQVVGGEYFDDNSMHYYYTDFGVKWYQNWFEQGDSNISTLLSYGVRKNFNRSVTTTSTIAGYTDSGRAYELPGTHQQAQASVIFSPTKHLDLSLGYAGVFDSKGTSHNGM
ncbi:autotransporter outer membrane beta-barrel domain-containing protein, partial [Escherichia coli]|uniref:autotransporter outer membrane beta-barrel domain-containing protein n=1 Tax=Escherichia coli TaxID=562 RepID=UPI0029E7CBB1